MKELNKTIKDLQVYVEHMGTKAKDLTPSQQKQLLTVFTVILQLLVAFSKASNLGKSYIRFLND